MGSRARLEEQYRLRFEANQRYREDVWRILCTQFFSRYVEPDATILDVGAGWGEFINNITASERLAMDLNQDTKHHLAEDVTLLELDCSQQWPLETATLDVVFTSNLLEHLPNKTSIERMVNQAHRCLKVGGCIICLGPNIKYTGAAYWDFWDHHVPLTDVSLTELLQMNGFEMESSIPRFLPYSMSMGRTPPLFLVSAYLKIRPAWRILGKQFLLVARKRN